MIEVKLTNWPVQEPVATAAHAALICYNPEIPEFGEMIDVEKNLFQTGHHTTIEHGTFSFDIEGVSVADVTFGLHLNHPFYNTDQRSGRFCADMFKDPSWKKKVRKYLEFFWKNDFGEKGFNFLMDYIERGVDIFNANMPEATKLAAEFIQDERPHASSKYIKSNAPKFAQEQMRVFIPVVFPTALKYSIDLITLASLHRVAWSPAMRHMISQMVEQVVEKFPNTKFMFLPEDKLQEDWDPGMKMLGSKNVLIEKPYLSFRGFDTTQFASPGKESLHPVDLLHFDPRMMNNNTQNMSLDILISIATMGQDQRHRTIRRGEPHFTGNFYLPPIPSALELRDEANEMLSRWTTMSLNGAVPAGLLANLAPYGAMVRYQKSGSINAVLHEQAKRLCWCAQEEIYHLSSTLRRNALVLDDLMVNHVISFFEPPCFSTGKCGEGSRYCGRELNDAGEHFPERRV